MEKSIAEEYREIDTLARQLAEQDTKMFPVDKRDKNAKFYRTDRYSEHVIDMITMFNAKYGDGNPEEDITEWLEQKLFDGEETKILTRPLWEEFKAKIKSYEYLDELAEKRKS